MAEQYLVLDIGGTFVKYAIMDRESQILAQGKVPADRSGEPAMLASLEAVRDAVAGYDYVGVAASVPGLIDTEHGIIHIGGAFEWIHDYPAGERYGAVFGKPITLANDGKCAAYAESWMGALADVDSGAVLVLGTGIGGGIVIDRKVRLGAIGGAGELSLLLHDFALAREGGELPNIDAKWTELISAKSICAKFAARKGLDAATGEELFAAYDAGDADAIAVLDDFGWYAAAGIYTIQSVLDLPRYAIGGGISARPETTQIIRKAVEDLWASRPDGNPFCCPEVVTCQFGNEANLIGALAFHLQA